MLRSLYTAGTGMVAQQHNLDVISNNLANINTTGFKQQRAEFQDLMYQTLKGATVAEGGGPSSPQAIQVGSGVKIAATAGNFGVGATLVTDNPYHIAITGPGFFKLSTANGPVYTRDGSFKPDGKGHMVNSQGLFLDPPVDIPEGSTAITIQENGDVYAIQPGQASSVPITKIELTNFANPAGLSRIGNNLYQATDASGEAQSGPPGENGTGGLQSGALEGSNVTVVEEMVHMITAQRAYEINSKAIQTADDMLGIVNNLKR